MTRSLCAVAACGLAFLLACTSDDRPAAPTGPRFKLEQAGSVSGNLLGASGTSICRSLPEGATPVVRIFTTPPAAPGFIASQSVACPESTFSIALDPGTYFLRVTMLPLDPGIGNLPLRTLVTNPIAVSSEDVRQDIYIVPGSSLGGGATFDGVPLAGIGLSVQYDLTPGFEAAFGVSGADGGWVDDLGREPMLLQSEVRYRVSAAEVAYSPCEALGASILQQPPTSVFLFPDELNAVSCGFTTAPAVKFSHNRTRLVVTPLPGDVGGLSPELSDQFGIGWGVQFPVAAGQGAIHGSRSQSQLYLGGLMVGIRPNRVLSGINVSSLEDCGSTCRDFGFGAKMSFVASPRFGKKVTWRYSDATSPEGVGLKVLQKSYDGVPPNDYVLFHFTFTNAGASAVTFYAGMYADWDIDGDGGDDIGATEMNGHLMYITNATPGGVYAGTLLLGPAPVSGNMFQTGAPELGAADVVAALAGDVRAPTASDPGDQNYLHALGPITLKRGKSTDIWVAIVAGESHHQLRANAAAAAADVARRGDDTNDDSDGTDGFAISNTLGRYIQPLKPRCKRGCVR